MGLSCGRVGFLHEIEQHDKKLVYRMALFSGRNLACLEIREVAVQQALLNLVNVSTGESSLSQRKWGPTVGIIFLVQLSLMSSMTRQEQQWDLAAVLLVSKAATVFLVSLACKASCGVADDV